LAKAQSELVLVMVHHNVVEHLPEQSRHELGRRYMLENAPELWLLATSGAASVYGAFARSG